LPLNLGSADRQAESALGDLLRYLAQQDYVFVTPSPSTHAIVMARGYGSEPRLIDVLGWNFPFVPGSIDARVEALLTRAGAIETGATLSRSLLRASTLNGHLFLHSAYPTLDNDAVFFGPDSYRFADLIDRELGSLPLKDGASIVDIGTGSGVGAIVAATLQPSARVAMTDINANALRMASINVEAAGLRIESHLGAELAGVVGQVDVALANPPYIIDPTQRLYRDGGGSYGEAVSLRIARAAVARLAPGGRLILYTGSAISDGQDLFHNAMDALASSVSATLRYREIDPDVFNDELRNSAYAKVDRIAVVGAVVEMP
jgi:methylase of polypeptide subunit release factors